MKDGHVLFKPWMHEALLGSWSVFGVLLNHLEKQIFALGRCPLHILWHMLSITLSILHKEILWSVCNEQETASEKIKEDTAKTEYICFVTVAIFLEDLGRYIARSAALMFEDFVIWCECG